MAITKVKKYDSSPYHDDFDQTKNYHRVLFRPGYAVQARELTQLQTALQAQIDSFGQYNFKDGSRVVGGKVTVNTEYDFIKLTNASFTHSSSTYDTTYQTNNLANFTKGTILTGTSNTTNQVTAKVIETVASAGGDPHTIYIKYESSGDTNKTVTKFVAGEVVTSSGGTTYYAKVGASGITPIGVGSRASIEEGVYFISGCFAYVKAASVILDKYTNTPSYTIALKVDELAIAADDATHDPDGDLNDNATGTPNFAAPGANRYKIFTTLVKDNLVPTLAGAAGVIDAYTHKITLLNIAAGIVTIDETDKTTNTELTARLARRTHEESGDYAVRPYILDLREHKLVGNNGGYLASGSVDKIAVGIEPSVSYVKGYRIENLTTDYIPVNKPRHATRDNIQDNATTSVNNIGNYVTAAASAIDGTPDINTFKTVQLKNSSAAVIGTARIRNMQYDATAAKYRIYLFDVAMGANNFGAVTNMVQGPVTNSGTNFTVSALTNANRINAGDDGLVFKLPRDGIKTLKDGSNIETIYTVRERAAGTLSSSQTLAIGITDGILANATDMVITIAGGDPIVTTVAAMPAHGGTSFTLNCAGSTGSAVGAEVQVLYSVYRAGNVNSKLKSKTYETITGQTISADGSTSYGLGRADAIAITSITDVNNADIKDKFTLDAGQTDSFYGESKLVLKGGNVIPNGNMTVAFTYWSHGSGDYFTVDSYPAAHYANIPSFSSKQGAVELRDCVDFRPTKGSGSPTTGNEFATGTGPDVTHCPLPGSIMTNDITYWLPRIDKLYIDRDGKFQVIEGVAAPRPSAPEDPEDAMVIYKLKLNPYVFKMSDIKPTMVDNKRYTMRDIGKIDKRVKNLEYYTSLSLLEKEAADTQIFDGTGNNGDQRFKNGFIVDGFYGHDRGNITHADYNVAIDRANGILRPKVVERNVNLIRNSTEANGTTSGSTTYAKLASKGGIVTMPYVETAYITQPYSSYAEFVNPYNVFSWNGQITLSPESDEWKETEIRPDVIINDVGMYDQLVAQAEESGILGTIWNEWTTNWAGTDDSVQSFDEGTSGMTGGITVTTTTTTTNQSRSGFQTTAVPDTQLKDMGSRVVEVNFIPFIRSRKIWFKAELMKPNTKVYAFFNGQDVTGYCDDAVAFTEWSGTSATNNFYDGATVSDTGDGVLITDAAGAIEGSFIIPRNDTTKIKTGTRLFRLTDSSTNVKANETTSAEGVYHAQGLLEVSENVIISTKVPKFVTSEISDNRTVESTSVNTQNNAPVRWVDPLAQTFLCDTSGGSFATSIKLYFAAQDDALPVNVSIRSVENGIPTQKILPGASINVYPSTNTDNTRQEVAGISDDGSTATTVNFDFPVYLSPDQEYAIVLMSNSDDYKVFVAEMGGTDLTNQSYKITKQPYQGVFFTSQNASTWTPEQTKDLKFILNTADFTDLKSPVDRSATLTLVNDVVPTVKLGSHPFQFLSHPTGTTLRIRVLHPNHGMYDQTAPGRVTISGAVDTNGVLAGALNASHIISNNTVDHNSYEIVITEQASSVATDGTIFGGGTAVKATTNNLYNTLYPAIGNLSVPGTNIKYYLTSYSGKSMDGAESDYAAQNEVQILANGNNSFNSPLVIASAINEANSMSGAKSFSLRCVLSYDPDRDGKSYTHVSPVIDLNRSSATIIENITNDATTNSSAYTTRGTYVAETTARNTSNMSKYITKKVELNDQASVLDVYINANKPNGANIDLYYKVGKDDAAFEDKVWIIAPSESTILTDNSNAYREVHYSIDPAGDDFSSFAFKIVLRSTNSSHPPTLKDFRAIAST